MNNNLKTGKVSYILGAGSSIGHSKSIFPDITDLFSKIIELKKYKTDRIKHIKEYVKEKFGENIWDNDSKINMEDLMTFIDIEIERTNDPIFYEIRADILKLIHAVIYELQHEVKDESEYDHFINILKEEDTIITFNWDSMLDKIMDGKIKQYKYSIEKLFANYERVPKFDSLFEPPYCIIDVYDSKGYYLKLHGSFDWLYCDNSGCITHNKVFKIDYLEFEHRCGECHEPMKILIIPPVLNKFYKNYPIIRKLWTIAVNEMQITEHLVFWGYSLPPTDFYSNWLIRNCRKNIKTLTIINPKIIEKSRDEKELNYPFIKRFYDMFRDIFRDINEKENVYLYEYFDDFDSGISISDKYPHLKKELLFKNL